MRLRQIIPTVIISLAFAPSVVLGQQQPPVEDVVRIHTELVQTGVVVLDKEGRFVEGLRKEQFVLKVDGQPVTPIFFERVMAGASRELEVERSVGAQTAFTETPNLTPTSYRGRTRPLRLKSDDY